MMSTAPLASGAAAKYPLSSPTGPANVTGVAVDGAAPVAEAGVVLAVVGAFGVGVLVVGAFVVALAGGKPVVDADPARSALELSPPHAASIAVAAAADSPSRPRRRRASRRPIRPSVQSSHTSETR